jgi:predicted small metal-binding protein
LTITFPEHLFPEQLSPNTIDHRLKEAHVSRKIADCRDFPSESQCTLSIAGEEDEVIAAAAQHAVAVHGHEDNDELRSWLKNNLKSEALT